MAFLIKKNVYKHEVGRFFLYPCISDNQNETLIAGSEKKDEMRFFLDSKISASVYERAIFWYLVG